MSDNLYKKTLSSLFQNSQDDQNIQMLDQIQKIRSDGPEQKDQKNFISTQEIDEMNIYSYEQNWWQIGNSNHNLDLFDSLLCPNIQITPEYQPATLQQQNLIMYETVKSEEKVEQGLKKNFSKSTTKRQSKKKLSKTNQLTRSETKNVPKNYYKAIMILVRDNPKLVRNALEKIQSSASYQQIWNFISSRKHQMNKISDLKNLWINNPYARQFRVLTEHFLRKNVYLWIYNSRVQNKQTMLKYRSRIMQGVRNPQAFQHLKINLTNQDQ